MTFGEVWLKCLSFIFSFFFFFLNPTYESHAESSGFFLSIRISIKVANWQYLNLSSMISTHFPILLHEESPFSHQSLKNVVPLQGYHKIFFYWYTHFSQSPYPSTPWCCLTAWKGKKWVNVSLKDHLSLKIQIQPNGYFPNVSKVS